MNKYIEKTDAILNEMTPILKDVVVVYIIDKEGNRVILGERKKIDKPGLGRRVGIGGTIEIGESPIQALLREVIEEIGTDDEGKIVFELQSAVHVGIVYFLFPHKKDVPGYNQRCFVFVSSDYTGTPVESNDINPEWYPLSQLPKDFMWEDNLLWVQDVLEGFNIDGVFVYREDNSVFGYKSINHAEKISVES